MLTFGAGLLATNGPMNRGLAGCALDNTSNAPVRATKTVIGLRKFRLRDVKISFMETYGEGLPGRIDISKRARLRTLTFRAGKKLSFRRTEKIARTSQIVW